MKYTLVDKLAPEISLQEFADEHELEMVVVQYEVDRFVAKFKDVEVKDDCVLIGTKGEGTSPEAAIEDYAYRILGKLLVYRAYMTDRKEMYAPKRWSRV